MKKILVSTCLYGGKPVRYDGKSKEERDSRFLKWKEEGRLVPVCPEVFGGLPVPRTDAQRQHDGVVTRDGRDVTDEYVKGAKEALRLAEEEQVVCALLKEKSPSCGSGRIYDGTFEGNLIDGEGVAAEMLRKAGVPVYSEEELDKVEKLLKEKEDLTDKDRNIVLIGMPSCGKSVTGVVLAKSLNMNFIDTDLLIQERTGKALQDIINEDGMTVFKETEEEVLKSVNVENTVIATGGSAVYYHEAMEHLKNSGTVVYIKASLGTIKKRLKNITTRGVAMESGQTMEELYDLRVPLYERYADVCVKSDKHYIEKTVEDIINAVNTVR